MYRLGSVKVNTLPIDNGWDQVADKVLSAVVEI